ncbi:MAG: metal ABC transporter permease [Corynebacterium matruchotii]|uniref:metal ABC transporter permease n=1 Tax=Corynebacterium matruchotii TaxID=43768 RepID=UPI00361ABDC3
MVGILTLPIAEVVVVGVLLGIVGALAIVGKRVFFSESLSHGTFPGAVLGVVIGQFMGASSSSLSLWLFVGAALFCIPLAWLMRYLASLEGISPTAAAGIVLTVGYALGVFLLRWFQPLPLKVEGFLTGSLLAVSHTDVLSAAAILVLAVIALVTCGRRLAFYYFDPIAFRVAVRNSRWWLALMEGITLGLLCASMVVAIPAVGSILSIAILVAPAAGVQVFARNFAGLILWSGVAGVGIGITGLLLAVWQSLSAGGMVAVVAGLFYLGCRSLGWILCMSWTTPRKPKITSNAFGISSNEPVSRRR